MNEKINTIQKIGNWISALLLGNTRELIARIDERTIYMQEDIKDMKPKVDDMFPKVDLLWKDKTALNHSPRQLNDYGMKILNNSGIKEIMDEKKEALLARVRAEDPKNAYDAEQGVLLVAKKNLLVHHPELLDQLKGGAFKTGTDLDTVLFVGGIYLRNLIFPALGFSIEDNDGS